MGSMWSLFRPIKIYEINIFLLVETYIKETVEMLKLFEKDCMDTYVALEAKTKENSVDERLCVLEKK